MLAILTGIKAVQEHSMELMLLVIEEFRQMLKIFRDQKIEKVLCFHHMVSDPYSKFSCKQHINR